MRHICVAAFVGLLLIVAAGSSGCAQPSPVQPDLIGPAPNLAGTRGVVAASPELAVFLPVDAIPAVYREVGRGPAVLPSADGEAPSSLLATYQNDRGDRLSFTFTRVERPILAQNLLAFFARRYDALSSCAAVASNPACEWKSLAPLPVGDEAVAFGTTGANRQTTIDIWVRGVVTASVEMDSAVDGDMYSERSVLVKAVDDRIQAVAPR